ncbi:MAG: RidA family protein [Alphaproteobacteria bacterium]
MNVDARLKELKLELPPAPAPVGRYQRCIQVGNLWFFSGQLPFVAGKILHPGHVGGDVTVEQGYQAGRVCALNCLAQIRAALGSFERLQTIVRVEGHVNSAPGFTGHAKVLDGATDLFLDVLGARAGHARTAFGHNELPLNAPLELVLTVASLS